MKRKNIYSVLIAILTVLTVLCGSGGGVAWGQAYKKGYVTRSGSVHRNNNRTQLRRTNDLPGVNFIKLPANVGGELGAGESVKIVNDGSNESIYLNNSPNGNTVSGLSFGSDQNQNIVIRSYTGGGFAMGWISFVMDISHNGNVRVASGKEGWNESSKFVSGHYQQPTYFLGNVHYAGGPRIMPSYPDWMQQITDSIEYDHYTPGENRSKAVWSLVRAKVPNAADYFDQPARIPASGTAAFRVFSFNKFSKDRFQASGIGTNTNPNPWNARWNGNWGSFPGGGTADKNQKMTNGSANKWDEKGGWSSGMPSTTESFVPCCNSSIFEMSWRDDPAHASDPDYTGGIVNAWHHNGYGNGNPYFDGIMDIVVGPSPKPDNVYTSSINSDFTLSWPVETYSKNITTMVFPADDSIPLVQINGKIMRDGLSLTEQIPLTSPKATQSDQSQSSVFQFVPQGTYDITGASWPNNAANIKDLANYKRPTTAIITGNSNHTFSDVTFKEINWWYTRDTIWTVVEKAGMFGCCAGAVMGLGINPTWDRNIPMQKGRTHLDAAIVLEGGANVCVVNDIADQTKVKASTRDAAFGAYADSVTDALVILPDDARSTLRVGGNFDSINMAHHSALPPTQTFYKQSDFPVAADSIHSYPSNVNSFSSNSSSFQFGLNSLGAFNDGGKINLPALLYHTDASVLGVRKNYNYKANTAPTGNGGKNAEWTTHVPSKAADHPGVIEIGDSTKGTDHMHIFSGGMLKNFSGCTVNSSFAMYLGHPAVGLGDNHAAHFYLNGNQPVYITNYGVGAPTNPCLADLLFYKAATNSVESAFANATGNSIMRIQAYSDVELRANTTINATGKGNELYMLSDAGNVITQKFDFTNEYISPEKRGMLGIWAEDRDDAVFASTNCKNTGGGSGNRNSLRGNVYLNDVVTVTRPSSSIDGTETNIWAANNIRTSQFIFVSDNQNNDSTNIVSRKGDIYLGYGEKAPVYDDVSGAADPNGNGLNIDQNIFNYKVNKPTNKGVLTIKAGWDDAKPEMTKTQGMEGGNIYFTQIGTEIKTGGEYPTNITIPYSSEYICDDQVAHKGESLHNRKESYQAYEHSGIIGGLGPCGVDRAYPNYAGKLLGANSSISQCALQSLIYHGNNGDLNMDAGRRGNIILNKGARLDYQTNDGNAIFRTREGDIDMRDPFDAQKMQGGLLFLAQLENLADLSKIGVCGCDEERNNVYLQDFQYKAQGASGSVFVGADNNIKLNYGGLTNIGTRQDPFLSKAYEEKDGRVLKIGRGYNLLTNDHCGLYYHCDLDGNENKARDLLLDFGGRTSPLPAATSGGFAAVASDMIDVYKNLIYYGGNGTGMGSVPGTGTLHGESVSGYGLFMKTQGNKKNWTANVFRNIPKCPTDCAPTGCGGDGKEATGFLHNTVRMTFHSDARFRAENQRVHLESPVIETFGVLELNTLTNGGSNAQITVKTDSLICHDSMVIIGSSKVKLSSWSGLPNDQPIIKLGYSRKAAPFEEWAEENKRCRECVSHYKGKVYAKGETPLDTMFVKFGPTTELRRQNVMVIDHTVLSFLTDSFDHVKGGEVLNARYFVDTLKIRNQVEFWTDKMHERDGHLELISEQQMLSKDYAGMYTRHLHLEPIGACGRPGSELWLPGLALDVITYSTFGGFGTQYTDVHVENQANLNPGFTSLRLRGQCFEQRCGTLTMKDLRLDGGSNLNISVGTKKGLNGEYSDAVDVDMLTTYGPVNVNLEIRPCERIEKRCYPIIYYKSVSPNSLNALKLNPSTIKIDGDEYPLNLNISTDGVVYVCVGDAHAPGLSHTVTMPETSGVKTTPGKGIWSVPARGNFRFSATYSGQKPLVVRTNRMFNGQQEVLAGILNSNGEYEYIVPGIQQEVTLTFGPDAVANELLKGTAVWSHGEMIYIRVDRADIASIYSVAGQLVKRVDLPEGDTSIPMSRGAYVITLKDGSVHKVIVK